MNVLHEINQLEKGGAERVILGILKHDKENKHMVYTYKDGPMREVFESHGATVYLEPKNGEPELDIQADIIHIHTGGESSHIAAATQNALPTIETVHSPITSAVKDAWVMCRVGVSNAVTRKNRKCKTIYNGIDVERLEKDAGYDLREKLGIPKDAFVIGRLGRIGLDKCLEEFLVACWHIQRSMPEKDIHVLIVGDEALTARGYMAKVKTMAYSLPLKNYHFVPAMEAVGTAYKAMDLFMYPSPTESFGLVYLEAMACGVPVLTWKNEVTEEILMGGAYLVEPTVRGLVVGAKMLITNKDVREQFAHQGSELALGIFTDERMSREYQDLYRRVYSPAEGVLAQ